MTVHRIAGSCHCGNIRLEADLAQEPENFSPRACDCDFCRKHGAAYVSDPAGALSVCVADESMLGRYRQGSGTADCLFCKNCGTLVGLVYADGERLFGTINTRIVDSAVRFGDAATVSPKVLSAGEKTGRWRTLWFADVKFQAGG